MKKEIKVKLFCYNIAITFLLLVTHVNISICQVSEPDCDPTAPVDSSTNSFCLPPDPTCLINSFPPNGLDDSTMKDHIVSEHNLYRAKVASGGESGGNPGPQPGTKCMAKLSWDNDLAKAAQNWADQCLLTGDKIRTKFNSPFDDSFVGQNIFVYIDPSGVSPTQYQYKYYWDQAIQTWYGEVIQFNRATVGKYKYTAATSHYTQMIWGRTIQIGCGFRRWEMDDGSGEFARILVCNYWPAGNRQGQPIYTSSTLRPPAVCETCSSIPYNRFINTTLNGALCILKPVQNKPCEIVPGETEEPEGGSLSVRTRGIVTFTPVSSTFPTTRITRIRTATPPTGPISISA